MSLPATEVLRRLVDLNDVDWLGEPGLYVLRESLSAADRSRMSRIARRAGCILRSSRDHSGLLVDVRRTYGSVSSR